MDVDLDHRPSGLVQACQSRAQLQGLRKPLIRNAAIQSSFLKSESKAAQTPGSIPAAHKPGQANFSSPRYEPLNSFTLMQLDH